MSGRIRTIKPELLEDAITARLSHLEFRLFVSMILMADDYGNLRATQSLIVGSAFWGTGDSAADVESAMAELEEVGLVRTYELRGQLYAHVCGWAKHQRVDKPGKPRVPAENEPEARPARPWVTYVVRLGSDGPIKIGKAIDVDARIAKLQTGCPEKLQVIKVIGKNIEAELHKRFADYRKHGEWFEADPEVLGFFSSEWFATNSRKPREPFLPDLRPPTSDPEQEKAPAPSGFQSERRLKSVPPPPLEEPPPKSHDEIAIALQIRQHAAFRPLDAHAIATTLSMRKELSAKRIEWVLQAIDDCAAKATGLGLKPEALQAKLVNFCDHAKAPRQEAKEPERPAHVEDDDAEAVARIRRGPRRLTAQDDPKQLEGVLGAAIVAKAGDGGT